MTVVLVILLVLFAAFFLVRALYDRFWDKGLTCDLSFQGEYGVEDETAVLTEVLTNRKLLPMPVVEIDFHMDRRLQFSDGQNASLSDQSYRRDVFALSVNQRITRTLEFQCAGRGYFQIQEAGVTARDLFLTRKYISSRPQNTAFYVLPRPVPAERINIPFSRIMGALLSRKKVYDDPFEFAGLREYSRGDPMKYVNWKATARAGKLLTNLHESTLSQRVVLLLDMEGKGVRHADRLNEAAVRIACSLGERLLREGIEISLYSNGLDVQSGAPWKLEAFSGAGNILTLRKRLACVQAENGLAPVCEMIPPQTRPGEGDLLVLLTRDPRPETLAALSQAAGKERAVCIVPYEAEHADPAAPKNLELIWLEAK